MPPAPFILPPRPPRRRLAASQMSRTYEAPKTARASAHAPANTGAGISLPPDQSFVIAPRLWSAATAGWAAAAEATCAPGAGAAAPRPIGTAAVRAPGGGSSLACCLGALISLANTSRVRAPQKSILELSGLHERVGLHGSP